MPYKQKIGVEEKVRTVCDCLGQKISIREAARRVGADYETVKMWISIYENEGVEGFAHQGWKRYTAGMKNTSWRFQLRNIFGRRKLHEAVP